MTTFTTDDRIIAEKDGSFTVNVEGGTVSSPPHIVDSGASVMGMNANELADWLEWWTEGKPYPTQNQLIIAMLRQQADRIKELETKFQLEFEYAEKLLKAQEK
jgi:hypothetical protein